MKIKLLLLTAIINLSAFAQISIVNSDVPRVNDTLRYSTSSSTINYTATDSNFNWDFGNIKIDNQDIQKYFTPTQTPYILQFFTATYGIPETDLALGPLGGGASNVFSFYKTSNTALVILGRGATLQGLPLGIVYGPRDTVYKYPLTYGKSYSGNYLGEASLATFGALKQSGNRTTVVDGWGKITTPYGTYDCIRVKSIVNGTDSIVFGGFGIPIPSARVEYTWLAKNERYPILEVIVNSTTNAVTSIKMKDRFRPEAYLNNCNFTANRTAAATNDTITLNNQSFGKPKNFSWVITPNTFVYAPGSSANSENPRVIFTAIGDYSVKLSVNYDGGADDTLKINYIKIREGVVADFKANKTQPAISELVDFTDLSKGGPISWQWTITPSTGAVYLNGTSQISQNPKIQFNSVGNYTIQLRATNAAGNNTARKANYIQVYPVGLNQIKAEAFAKFFPNPGKNIIHFELLNKQAAQVTLTNILGQTVLTKTIENNGNNSIITDQLPRGIYMIEILQDNKKITDRLILE
jgi:PKD repeat protein